MQKSRNRERCGAHGHLGALSVFSHVFLHVRHDTVITDTVLHRAQLIHPTSRDLNTSHEHDRLACRLGDPGPNEAY